MTSICNHLLFQNFNKGSMFEVVFQQPWWGGVWLWLLFFSTGKDNVCVCVCVLVTQSCWLSVTPWTATRQATLSMGFSRQGHWSGLPFPSPKDNVNMRYTCICLKRTGLGEGVAAHSSILIWRTPWTEEPGRLPSMGSQRVRHDWSDLAHSEEDRVWAAS